MKSVYYGLMLTEGVMCFLIWRFWGWKALTMAALLCMVTGVRYAMREVAK